MTAYRALLFDIGEVVSAAPWPVLDELADVTGRRFPHPGPADPAADPIWQRYLAGELSYVGYWAEVATAAGYDDWKDFYRDVGDLPVERFCDPDATALIAEAHAAGLRLGALTNEGAAINGMGFFDRVPELESFEVLVDAAEFGERKPAPATYLRAADALGLPPHEIVFLDDTPACVWGADAVGMTGVLVDPADRRPAFDRVRRIVGLVAPTPAERTAAAIEAAANGGADAIGALLDPDVVVVEDGLRSATGRTAAQHRLGALLDPGAGRAVVVPVADDGVDTVVVEHRVVGAHHAVAVDVLRLRRDLVVQWSRSGRTGDRPG
jgi:putative hydrolase of the HAD superfamily